MVKKVLNLELGNLVFTKDINDKVNTSTSFSAGIVAAMNRYLNYDWGDLCEEDKEVNDNALVEGERIFAKYLVDECEVYIITEYDRSVTTILFSYEY